MLVGEAPGRSEDVRGEPFVGAAGRLLDELLASAGLKRDTVYIANILKCRPPANRNPQTIEIKTCTPFLRDQIRLVNPDVLVTLGNFASRFMLETTEGITQLRGTVRHHEQLMVLPVFHPAAALYDSSKRGVLFEDFELIGRLLGGTAVSPGE
jgi:DNA polymerase